MSIETLKEIVENFVLVFHNLDYRTYNSQHENGVLKVMIQTITNNVIPATTNNPLTPSRGGGRNLI
jgi:hypothetical protein